MSVLCEQCEQFSSFPCDICGERVCQYCHKTSVWVITDYAYYRIVKLKNDPDPQDIYDYDVSEYEPGYDHLHFVCNQICLNDITFRILKTGSYPIHTAVPFDSDDSYSDDDETTSSDDEIIDGVDGVGA